MLIPTDSYVKVICGVEIASTRSSKYSFELSGPLCYFGPYKNCKHENFWVLALVRILEAASRECHFEGTIHVDLFYNFSQVSLVSSFRLECPDLPLLVLSLAFWEFNL